MLGTGLGDRSVTERRPWFPTKHVLASTGSVAVSISDVRPGVVSSPAGWTMTGSA